MFKQLLLLGIVSGLLAGLASFIYQRVYSSSLGVDFSAIAKPVGIFISSAVGCVIAAIGYWILNKWLKAKTEPVFNLVFAVLSFASILPAFSAKLPLDMTSPELFPGLVIPMHFFPALAFFTIEPFFIKNKQSA
jgi:hypothetical protein